MGQEFWILEKNYVRNLASIQILLHRTRLKKILGICKDEQLDFKKGERLNTYQPLNHNISTLLETKNASF